MGHCISVYLMNKSELRDEKIKSIIEQVAILNANKLKISVDI